MQYDLTEPCRDCPFRDDKLGLFFRDGDRAQDIADSVRTGLFPCHKTTTWDDEGEQIRRPATQACAGALIALEHGEEPNQMMRIAERIGVYDRRKLNMDFPSCTDIDEWVDWHYERDANAGTAAESG